MDVITRDARLFLWVTKRCPHEFLEQVRRVELSAAPKELGSTISFMDNLILHLLRRRKADFALKLLEIWNRKIEDALGAADTSVGEWISLLLMRVAVFHTAFGFDRPKQAIKMRVAEHMLAHFTRLDAMFGKAEG